MMALRYWQARALETAGAIVLAVALMLVVIVLTGCSTTPMQMRRELYAPVPLNDPATRPAFTDTYARALAAAQSGGDSTSIAAYIDAGNAMNARNCSEWLSRVTLARRGLVASDHNLGVASALLTTMAGIGEWNPASVAVLGALQVAAQGFGSNLQSDVLGAPSQYQAQASVLGLLGTCSDQLLADAPGLRFSQAYARLENCEHVCSFDGAAAAASAALAATPIVVGPSGAIRRAP
jgi:hypothetical protein